MHILPFNADELVDKYTQQKLSYKILTATSRILTIIDPNVMPSICQIFTIK